MRLHHLKLVEQEMHPPDPLVDVPVPAIPSVTGQAVVDGIQPLLGGGIHAALVDAGQKGFNRLVLEGAGVAQHHWHLPAPGDQYPLYLGFGGFVGLVENNLFGTGRFFCPLQKHKRRWLRSSLV